MFSKPTVPKLARQCIFILEGVKMKRIICVSAILLSIFSILMIVRTHASTSRSFLQQTEEEIREYILELTPIGMNMEEARSVIEYHFQIDEWEYAPWGIDYENGIVRRFDPRIHDYSPPQIGVKSINLRLGSYRRSGRLLASTFVFAAWGFDENSELIDVHVSKSSPAM